MWKIGAELYSTSQVNLGKGMLQVPRHNLNQREEKRREKKKRGKKREEKGEKKREKRKVKRRNNVRSVNCLHPNNL